MTGDVDRITGFQHELRASGLTPSETHSFYGQRRGYLVGLTIKESKPGRDPITHIPLPGSLVLLIHARHRGTPRLSMESNASLLPAELRRELNDGRARISIENGITWLTFFDATSVIQQDRVIASLDALVDWLTSIGSPPSGAECESCKSNEGRPVFIDGRVHCLCAPCEGRSARASENPATTVKLASLAPIAVIASALLWSGLWIGSNAGLQWWHGATETRLYLPAILELPIASLAAFLVSIPFWILKRQAGPAVDIRWIATASLIISMLLGEWFLHLWLLGSSVGLIQILASLPQLWAREGAHAIIRAVVAFLAMVAVGDLTKRKYASSL